MISRPTLRQEVSVALRRARVAALLGPRQSGKTTLARTFLSADGGNYFDLEDPVSAVRLEQPLSALQPLRGLVVIDEVQRQPALFSVLRVLADRRPARARFLVLGSASPAFLQHTSESLAGRIELIDVPGLSLAEVGAARRERHWCRGGFPRSFLARTEADSVAWRRNYLRTLLDRDLPQLMQTASTTALLRFWTMVAHYHGQIWQSAEPARSLAVSEPTVRRYLDLLTGAYLVRQLPAWSENLGKRQVKAPKVYVRDTGILHTLLGIDSPAALLGHPKSGASWEGYAVEEILKALRPREAYFWATHQGAELDLLIFHRGRRIGFEIKRADAPRMTKSMHIALADLRLDRLLVLYPGTLSYPLHDRVEAVPLTAVAAWHAGTRL